MEREQEHSLHPFPQETPSSRWRTWGCRPCSRPKSLHHHTNQTMIAIGSPIFTFSLPSGIRIFATYPCTSRYTLIPTSSCVVKSRVLLSVEIYHQRDYIHPPEQARRQAEQHRPPSHSTKKYHPESSSTIHTKKRSIPETEPASSHQCAREGMQKRIASLRSHSLDSHDSHDYTPNHHESLTPEKRLPVSTHAQFW